MKKGKTVSITSFGKGRITLSIPYVPGKKENVGHLFGVYVDDSGKATRIDASAYDANSRSMIFGSNHLSVYGVGYSEPKNKFADISTHWAKESIDYVADRGLIDGTTATTFSPDMAISRETLITALGCMADVDVSEIDNDNATPKQAVTREEAAWIFNNYAKATDYTLPVTREAMTFADTDLIGSTYEEAVTAMQQAGVVMGRGDNRFEPKGNVTRAEIAAMLHRYIKLTIDPATAQGWAVNDAGQHLYYKDGKVLTGWQSIGSGDSMKRYYFTEDGIMVSGRWMELDEKWYYFNTDGSLAVNTKVDGYEVDENGVRITR